jgi:ATP-dependent Clp protease adaptor protein ClpS|tara:strand:- start:16405 stop:16704 length:300 start_codon:yes stop_codon:yes gene_type:complete
MAKEAIKTRATTKLEYPNRYNVIIYNDDYTPMEFVIKLLIEVFNKNLKTAKDITMEIHNNTSAVAGNYNFEIAEQKTNEAITIARANGHPLQLKTFPVE